MVRAILVLALLLPECGLLHRERPARPPTPIDLNTASLRKIERLPGITPSIARRIVEGRPYEQPDDLVARGILTAHELERIEGRVVVQRAGR